MKKLLLVFAVLLVLPFGAFATPVPDTGQTKCYDEVGDEIIPCPEPGEPFNGQDTQYIINAQSYTKLDENGNDLSDTATSWVMVRDNVTGLIWEVKTDDSSIHDKDNNYDWYNSQDVFITTLNEQNFGSYSDWRLPTIKELSWLVDSSKPWPGSTINVDYFPNTQPVRYWSSTTYANSTSNAWYVFFQGGYVSDGDKLFYFSVRAVRGGECGTFGNYSDNGDSTVTDIDTGLMWEVKTNDDGPRDWENEYNWEEALAYCENLTLAGYNDWRLPNRNELQSIIDYNSFSPSIDPIFSYTETSYYWSSTTYAQVLSNAWYVHFIHGQVGSGREKSNVSFVRAVRGGQCGAFGDLDDDCRIDCIDNCPSTPNGLDLGTCTKGTIGQLCISDGECGTGGLCSMQNEDTDRDNFGDACDNCPSITNPTQQDTYPPQGNGIGDACDCESDFDCDGDVDGTDAQTFKLYFGRNVISILCDEVNPCRGDFDCDQDCDGTDASLFKSDFGRSSFSNPCPACVVEEWCSYPSP